MDELNIFKVLRLVFQYLTPPDLTIAGQVSNIWYRVAKNESIERNTFFYFSDMVVKNFHLDSVLSKWWVKPRVNFVAFSGIRFYSSNNDVNDSNGNKNHSSSVYFDTDKQREKSFFTSHVNIFCLEENFQSKVLIIFCRSNSFKRLLKALKSLYTWIGDHDLTLWLAVVDELSFCRYNYSQHDCRINTEFILMFISNPSIKSYSHFIPDDCYTAEQIRTELKNFKEEIKLTPRSIAFMHISFIRIQSRLNELDTSIFKEVFPDVDLYPLYGTGSFVCCSFALCEDDEVDPLRIYKQKEPQSDNKIPVEKIVEQSQRINKRRIIKYSLKDQVKTLKRALASSKPDT
ncbi:hypothetical protein M0802_013242 [Mischocyttarus mexicanus]|nr:hypothetical protein M0802_013242 [Mischocyttarus mexicanus]